MFLLPTSDKKLNHLFQVKRANHVFFFTIHPKIGAFLPKRPLNLKQIRYDSIKFICKSMENQKLQPQVDDH